MRALMLLTLLLAGCGGSQAIGSSDMARPDFGGNWIGTLMHPAVTCTDGSVKAAFSGSTQWTINEDLAGLFLMWSDRCPVTANIAFTIEQSGIARQQGAPATCVNSSIAQAALSSGAMTIDGNQLSMFINETEHTSGAQTRDCEYTLSATMMRE